MKRTKAIFLPVISFSTLLIGSIRVYQFLTVAVPKTCRFYPSCSHYMLQAIQAYGAYKGTQLGLLRLCRCHPWHPGGVDPVPEII